MYVIVALVAAQHMFASVTLRATPSFAFLESRTFQILGNVSYSFYLWQSLVISFVKRIVAMAIGAHVAPAPEHADELPERRVMPAASLLSPIRDSGARGDA